MNFKAGDTIFSMAESKSGADCLIFFLKAPDRGMMLIIYGNAANGCLYNTDRFLSDGYDFSLVEEMTDDQKHHVLRRLLKTKMTRWMP